MENTPAVHLGSLDDSESIAELDFTDDDDCENNGDNSDTSLEDESNPDCNPDCNAETLKDFTYEDDGKIYAEGHAIRLLRLVGGTGPIQACLFKAFLHKTGNGMPYEALSYTWGTNEKTKQIILNGKRFMLTGNLYSALQYLRFKNEDRILWIDAICIDQSHIEERNHQVSHMASIYRDADRVLFWLGEPTYETNLLISSLIRLQARALDTPNITRKHPEDSQWSTLWKEETLLGDCHTLLNGLVLLLERPWFKRSWILQEVCFAKTGVVTCGTKAVAAHIFALAPWLLNHNPEAHCKAVLHMMPGATRSTRTFLSGREMRNFYSLLRRFCRSEATVPSDQVYALLNMATDANMAGFPRVDYKKKFEEVIASIFTYLFPTYWDESGRSHSYQSLLEFVEDFPRLRKAEIQAADDDVLLELRLSDDTELTQLHPQGAFRKAIQTGDAQLLQDLLRFRNINLNEKNYSYKVKGQGTASSRSLPPLCAAAACGFTDVVKLLARDSRLGDINSEDTENSQTPLSWAAQGGHKAVVELLLEMGEAKVDSKDKSGRTPLSWATKGGHKAVVKLLLATGRVEVDAKDGLSRTPLSWAAQNGHEAVVKLLLATGRVEVDTKDRFSRTPLSLAAEGGHEAVVKLLLKTSKVEVDSKDQNRRTPLSWAAQNGHEAVVNLLLAEYGVDPYIVDNSGQTLLSWTVRNHLAPIFWAAQNGNEAVVKLLLKTGRVEVDAKDRFSRTPFSLAAEGGHEALVKLLLKTSKVEVDTKDGFSRTPLSWAAQNGHEAVVNLLLAEYGVDPYIVDNSGQTLLSWTVRNHLAPIFWAAQNGNEAVVKLLLKTGRVEVDAKDRFSRTPFSLAAEGGHEALVKLLLKTSKVEVDTKDGFSRTPLSWAAQNGHEAVVKLLFATGKAEFDSGNGFSRTPFL